MGRVHADNPLRKLEHTQARLSYLEYPAKVVCGILVYGWIEVNLNVCMRVDWAGTDTPRCRRWGRSGSRSRIGVSVRHLPTRGRQRVAQTWRRGSSSCRRRATHCYTKLRVRLSGPSIRLHSIRRSRILQPLTPCSLLRLNYQHLKGLNHTTTREIYGYESYDTTPATLPTSRLS